MRDKIIDLIDGMTFITVIAGFIMFILGILMPTSQVSVVGFILMLLGAPILIIIGGTIDVILMVCLGDSYTYSNYK